MSSFWRINTTGIKCDEPTINAIKSFIKEHMDYTIPVETAKEDIMEKQDDIRNKIKPYLKEHLDYLKDVKLGKSDFYALFMLIIVIDKIKDYKWSSISDLLYIDYDNPYSINGIAIKDNYEDYDETDATCCCGKQHCRAKLTAKITNDEYTFIVGSFCIQKTSIEYYKEKTRRDKQRKYEEEERVKREEERVKREERYKHQEQERLKREEEKRDERAKKIEQGIKFCQACQNIELDETWKTLCKTCYAHSKGFRTCMQTNCNKVIKNTYIFCYNCKNELYKK